MMREPSASTEDLAGSRAGAFELLRHIARAGAGELYLARHTHEGQEACVLVLTRLGRDTARENPGLVDRFRREVQATRDVGHPALVEHLDCGLTADGLVYTVTGALRGETLRHRLERRGALALSEAARWTDTLMEILGAAHSASVVHRSLEPANVFLHHEERGEEMLRLLGFGVASLLSGESTLGLQITRDGHILGTPHYMAPEQATTSYGGVGPWTDVYSLGALAFHMFTGRPPYVADKAGEILLAHLQAPLPSLRDHRPALSTALDAVIRQALAKRPEARFATMEAFRRAFRGSLGGSVVLPMVPALDDGALMTVAGGLPRSAGKPPAGSRTAEALGMDDTVPPFQAQGAETQGTSTPEANAAMAATVPPSQRMAWAHTLRPEAFAKAPDATTPPMEAPTPSSPWSKDQDSLTERPPALDSVSMADLGPASRKTPERDIRDHSAPDAPVTRRPPTWLWVAIFLGVGLLTLALLLFMNT